MIAEILAGLLRFNLALALGLALVAALRPLARKRLGAQAAYRLWLVAPLAALAVLLPPRQMRAAAPPPIPAPAATMAAIAPRPLATRLSRTAAIPPRPTGPRLSIDEALLAIWAAGALSAFVYLANRQRRFVARMGALRPVAGEAGVWRAAAAAGPAVVGALRPRIVLPDDFEARFSLEERAVVLAHERTHLARQDARVNGALALAQCVNWFNPVLHLAVRQLRLDQELACDAAVMRRLPGQRRRYAEALLKTQIAIQPLPLGCYWPARAGRPLEERIAMLKQQTPSPRRQLAGLIATLAGGLAISVAAWASQPAHLVAAPPPLAPPSAHLTVASEPAAPPATAAAAPTPDHAVGDWIGALKTPDLRLAVHIRKGVSGDVATLDSPDQGAYDLPISNVISRGDDLSFELPKLTGSYAGHWDAAGGRWVGQWTQLGHNWPLILAKGVYPPEPKVAGLDGDWSARLLPTLRLRLHIFTDDAHGTRGSMDSPDQNSYGVPLSSIARTGDHIVITQAQIGMTLAGDLSSDGQTLTATFTQNGSPLPVTFTRGALAASASAAPASASTAQPVDFAGTWVFEGELENQGQVTAVSKPVCVFQQAGERITGTCKGPNGLGVAQGAIDGAKVSWRWDETAFRPSGISGAVTFEGELGADNIVHGTMTIAGQPGSGPFSGRRQ